MAKLPDGSWFQVARISNEPFQGSNLPWESYFYEGKSIQGAWHRMGTLRTCCITSEGEFKPFSLHEPPIARVELRRVRGEGDGYEVSEVIEVIDSWQSPTLQVYSPVPSESVL